MGGSGMPGMVAMSYGGRLLLVGVAANLLLAGIFAARLARPGHAANGFGPAAEAGHVLTAAGMAYMFAPVWAQRLPPDALAGFYLAIGVGFLGLNTRGACAEASRWCCCCLLVAESFAMAYMFAYGSWASGDLTAGLRVLFGGMAAVAAGRWVLRGRVALPAGLSTMTLSARVVMGAGMLTMLALAQPM